LFRGKDIQIFSRRGFDVFLLGVGQKFPREGERCDHHKNQINFDGRHDPPGKKSSMRGEKFEIYGPDRGEKKLQ